MGGRAGAWSAPRRRSNLGLNASVTFSGALAFPYLYPWPQRPAGLIDEAFAELGRRWKPILDAYDEAGVDVGYEIHPGEDVFDGATFEMFLDAVGRPQALQHQLRPVALPAAAARLSRLHRHLSRAHQGVPRQGRRVQSDRPAGRLFRLSGLGQPGRPLPLARRRPGRFRRHLLQARAIRLRQLGGARMGVLPEASGGRRGRRRAVHPAPHHPRHRESLRRFRRRRRPTRQADLRACWGLRPRRRLTHRAARSEREARHGDRRQRSERREAARSATAWSAAGRAPSSARCTGSRRAWTASSSWSPARCRRTRHAPRRRRAELGLDPTRSYGSLRTRWPRPRPSARTASRRSPSSRPTTCTSRAAKAFLEAGIHVICDKPLTTTLAEAKKLAALVEKTGKVFVLTHNYTGYPMVRQAREMVAKGELGDDPARAGRISAGLADRGDRSHRPEAGGLAHRSRSARAPAAAIGDIGTHAYNLARFVSGLELEALCGRSRRLRARAACSTTMPTSCCASRAARKRHDLGEPGGARQRERAEAARLRHQGRARMGAGRPELSLVHAVRPAEAADHPRRRRRGCRPPRASPACRPAIRKAISKASPTSIRKRPAPSAPPRRKVGEAAQGCDVPDRCRTASKAWPSSRPAFAPRARTRPGCRYRFSRPGNSRESETVFPFGIAEKQRLRAITPGWSRPARRFRRGRRRSRQRPCRATDR